MHKKGILLLLNGEGWAWDYCWCPPPAASVGLAVPGASVRFLKCLGGQVKDKLAAGGRPSTWPPPGRPRGSREEKFYIFKRQIALKSSRNDFRLILKPLKFLKISSFF